MIQPLYNFCCVDEYVPSNFSFTRSTSASNTAESGYLQLGGTSIRTDYDKNGLPLGWNIEEGRQNLFATPETLTNATFFNPVNTTISTISTIANPYGVFSTPKLVETSDTGEHSLGGNFTVTNGENYSFSFYARGGERGRFELEINNHAIGFDLGTKSTYTNTLGASLLAADKCSIIELFNGWFRCKVSVTMSTTNLGWKLYLNNATVCDYDGIVGYGCYFDCFQLEAGAIPTSYIPGEIASQTRGNDELSLSYTSTVENTFYIEFYKNFLDTSLSTVLSFSDATSANDLRILLNTSGNIYASITNSSTETVICSAGEISYSKTNKIALVFKNHDFSLYVNGTKLGELTSVSLPMLTTLRLGSGITPTSYINARIKRFSIFNRCMQEIDAKRYTI